MGRYFFKTNIKLQGKDYQKGFFFGNARLGNFFYKKVSVFFSKEKNIKFFQNF